MPGKWREDEAGGACDHCSWPVLAQHVAISDMEDSGRRGDRAGVPDIVPNHAYIIFLQVN